MLKKKDLSIKNRLLISTVLLSFLFSSLIYQLYTIQISQSQDYIREAILQRSVEFPIYPKRGIIFDRNLIPITNNQLESTIIVDKQILLSDRKLFNDILNATGLGKDDLNKMASQAHKLLQLPIKNKGYKLDSENVYKVDIVKRYDIKNPLAHVIGHVNKSDNKGKAGIEFVHDEFLKNHDRRSYLIEYDRDRKIILGTSLYEENNYKSGEPNSVQLTIDINLQSYIEDLLDENHYNGSVTVTDVDSGEILSMVSRPNYDQENIEKHLQASDMSLYNKAIQVRYPPGSVFKTVVLLAALEENLAYINTEFLCQGYELIYGLDIKCSASHGYLSLKNAFAKSCNSYFIQLGKKLGPEKIINMAQRLGLDKKVGIGLVEEIEGILPGRSHMQGAAIGNIAIGQGFMEVTPIQITNMMLTLCNRGKEKDISIVKAITNQEGRTIKKYEKTPEKRILREEISDIAVDFLKEVVNTGTARSINLAEIGGAGGKTGSAQAVLNGEDTVHGWFTGFYPAENPKYIITILIENSPTGSQINLPIFETISKKLYNLNY